MNREFFINIILLVGINLLVKPFYIFGIDMGVQNTVGVKQYGLYFALFNFTFIFQFINDFGIQNYNNRSIAQDHQLLDKFLSNILGLKAILAVLYLSTVFVFAKMAGYDNNQLLLFLGINWILSSLLAYFRTNISGLEMYRTDSFISSVDKILLILVVGYLLWFSPDQSNFKIEWFVFSQTCTLILTNLLAFFVVFGKTKKFKLAFNPTFKWSILKQSYPFALAIFLMTIYTKVDGVMVERMLPDGREEAGIYASGYRLLDAFNMLGFLFSGLLLPMFSRMIKENIDIKPLLQMSLHLIWTGSITLATACFFFNEGIMNLLYLSATPYWAKVMGILMLSFIAMSGNYILGTLLTANNNLKQMNWLFIICIFLNIGFNFIFIPIYKAEGAAWATCVTQFFALFGQIVLVTRTFKFGLNLQMWLRPLTLAILLLCLGNFLLDTTFHWIVNFCIFILSGILLSFAIKLVQPFAILKIIREPM